MLPISKQQSALEKKCYEQVIKSDESGEINVEPSKSKYCKAEGGRKTTTPDVRRSFWLVYWHSWNFWKFSCQERCSGRNAKFSTDSGLHNSLKKFQKTKKKKIAISNRWIQNWMSEYGVSLRHSNKRFQIKQTDREESGADYLKSIWTVWKFFLDNYTFFYKKSIFDPRPENWLSFSTKLPPKNCLAIV